MLEGIFQTERKHKTSNPLNKYQRVMISIVKKNPITLRTEKLTELNNYLFTEEDDEAQGVTDFQSEALMV